VSLSKAVKNKLEARDKWCWHCGATTDLAPHHRKNRRAGGSKLLDRLDNLILVCQAYNFQMEANAEVAKQAREFGHKLRSWDDFSVSVFDRPTGTWYVLDEEGGKHAHRGISSEDEATGFRGGSF
jgi:ribosomal protein S27AE